MAEVGLAVRSYNERVETSKAEGIFEHCDPQAMFEIRSRLMSKVFERTNACQAHVSILSLIDTWKEEDAWEKAVLK